MFGILILLVPLTADPTAVATIFDIISLLDIVPLAEEPIALATAFGILTEFVSALVGAVAPAGTDGGGGGGGGGAGSYRTIGVNHFLPQ